MGQYFNRARETALRKELRKSSPEAKLRLWQALRAKQLLGLKFRRQHSVGPYVLDFYCAEMGFAIEVDGKSHESFDARGYDDERQHHIEEFDIIVLRFTNEQAFNDLQNVIEEIKHHACINFPLLQRRG